MKYTDLCAQAEKALEGVTDGPWEFIPAGNRPDVCRQGKWVDGYICAVESQNFVEDARFIAFTRAWVPAAAAAIRELEAERERLALAICGGEDAPGYASAQTVETLEKVARDNARAAMGLIDRALAAEAKVVELTRDAGEAERSVYDRSGLPPVTVHQACTWPTCLCTAKGQFCQGAVRVTLRPAPDAVEALVKAAEAWGAFKAANTTVEHWKAVEQLDAVFAAFAAAIRKGGEG